MHQLKIKFAISLQSLQICIKIVKEKVNRELCSWNHEISDLYMKLITIIADIDIINLNKYIGKYCFDKSRA